MRTKNFKRTRYKVQNRNGSHSEELLANDINKIHYLEGLVTKQLDLYNWCEEKVSTLATIDSILLGAAILFVEKIMKIGKSATCNDKIANAVIISFVLFPLFFSLAIALWHIRPKMGKASNTGRPNHRSSNGIRHFSNAIHYRESLSNYNIWKNQKSIKIAVFLDIIGLFGFIVIIVYWAIFYK